MSSIGCKENPATSHRVDASIVNTELIGLCNFVIAGLWMTREEFLECCFPSFNIFVIGKTRDVTVLFRASESASLLWDRIERAPPNSGKARTWDEILLATLEEM
jgi:hypothetical protein